MIALTNLPFAFFDSLMNVLGIGEINIFQIDVIQSNIVFIGSPKNAEVF
jgi:hypothetical protein